MFKTSYNVILTM